MVSWLRRLLDPEHRFTEADRRRQLLRYATACDALATFLGDHGLQTGRYRALAERARELRVDGWGRDDLLELSAVPRPAGLMDAKEMDFADVPAWQEGLQRAFGALAEAALELRAVGSRR